MQGRLTHTRRLLTTRVGIRASFGLLRGCLVDISCSHGHANHFEAIPLPSLRFTAIRGISYPHSCRFLSNTTLLKPNTHEVPKRITRVAPAARTSRHSASVEVPLSKRAHAEAEKLSPSATAI